MPSVSKKQQKFMGIVRSIQKGEQPASKFSKDAQDAAKSMKKGSVKKYAKTKHDDLPTKKIKEGAYKSATKNELAQYIINLNNMLAVAKSKKMTNHIKFIQQDIKDVKKALSKKKNESVNEAERDYKDEYKKFQSSTKSKKYRAELNKYNRDKGTYGNGDGKDASHKGGKIVGFEKESKNRGRAEKSRLKKEGKLNENPAAMAAATAMTKMKMKNPKTGKDVSAASALKNKDNPNHKKAKSIFQRLKDKFSKKKKEEPKNKMSAKDAAKSAGINITNFTREHLGEKKLREFIRHEIKKSVDESMTKQQADITLKQLGGNKFIAMTGAKQFSFGKQGLGFRIGKNSKSINYVRVDLKSNDLYDMEFIRIRGTKIKVVKKVTGVYNDQLQKIFTKHTGLYTRL